MKVAKFLLIAIAAVSPLLCEAAEIVFCGNTDNQYDLYRADLKTGEIIRLTETAADELMPAVAPDGKKIVFVSDRAGANSLYMMNLESQT
ncbi:MAG TPA: hypothetical protein DCG57_17910, partial [Candidatus Riflebacteria bacterium]|nr:hypothetical protein [Candidatus Riflebacteria bacterium]